MSGISASIAIWQLLNTPSVTSLLDGGVYRYNRPINSRKRDVVISTPEQGKVDINIHVPNLELQGDQTSPDLARMKTISDAVLALLSGFEIDRVAIPERDKDGQWFATIRVMYGQPSGLTIESSLIALTSVPDGYGGSTATESVVSTLSATLVSESRANQMEIVAGAYLMTTKTDWTIPKGGVSPQKYMKLRNAMGDYVILGISTQGNNWYLSTEREDAQYT